MHLIDKQETRFFLIIKEKLENSFFIQKKTFKIFKWSKISKINK